jgi:hypothetical protein
MVILALLAREPSKEERLRRGFAALLNASHSSHEDRYNKTMAKLLGRADTSDIAVAIKIGSGDIPDLRQTALAYLACLVSQASVPQKLTAVRFALLSSVTGDAYTTVRARYCLDQFDPKWLQYHLRKMALDASSDARLRGTASRELLRRGGPGAVTFVLGNAPDLSTIMDIAVSLRDAAPYDIVAGSRDMDTSQLPVSVRRCVDEAKLTLRTSREVSFTQTRVAGLGSETAKIEIHNEAPVNLYLDLTPTSAGSGYTLEFPAGTTRTVDVRAASYYFRADARRSDITGLGGFHEFAGSYSHTWVFFLEDQRAQMRAKYPDMQFR